MASQSIIKLDQQSIELGDHTQMGGFTALRAALIRPERVRALVLMDTDAGAETFGHQVQYALMRGVVQVFGLKAMTSRMMSIMFGQTTRREQPALCQAYRQRFMALDKRSVVTVARALSARDDLLPRLGEITCPALVIVGEEDQALPVPLSQRLAAGIRGAELLVVPRVGHLSTVEAPARLTEAIERFVEMFEPANRQSA